MTETRSSSGTAGLPDPIVFKLRQFIRRARRLILIRGLGITGGITLACFLLIMTIDAGVTLFAQWPRWVLTLSAYAVAAASAAWFLIRPLARSFTLTGAARLIEAHHPELQERISSAVELLTSKDLPSLRGSEVLIGALTLEAVRDAEKVQPKREISLRPALPFVGVAALLTLVLGGLFLAIPRQTSFLLARAAAPFLNLPNVHAADLRVEPGDTLVAEGSPLQIHVTASSPAITFARLCTSAPDGRQRWSDMTPLAVTNAAERRFVYGLPKVEQGFRYRIHAGDAVTRFYDVRVATPPVIEQLVITTEYPAYSAIPTRQEKDGPGDIRALAGSVATVAAKVNKFVPSAALLVITGAGTNAIPAAERTEDNGKFYDFRIPLTPQTVGLWTIRLLDEVRLCNAPFKHAIQAVGDGVPSARLLHLEQREIRLNPEDRLPVFYRAEDDVGLINVALTLEVDGHSMTDRVLFAATTGPLPARIVQDGSVIDLADPAFAQAQRIVFRVKATDNLPDAQQGPQTGQSEAYTIRIDAKAPPWKEQTMNSQEQRIRQGVEAARKELAAAQTGVSAVKVPVEKERTLSSNTVSRLDAARDHIAKADETLRDTARSVSDGYYAQAATNLAAIADEHVSKAASLAGQIKLADEPAKRGELAGETRGEIDRSLTSLDRLLKELGDTATALRRAAALENLAGKQAELAQTKNAMESSPPAAPGTNAPPAPPSPATPDEWKKAQEKVAADMAKIARETPGVPQAVAALNELEASKAQQQAQDLAARQSNLLARVQEEAAEMQKINRGLYALAAKQEKLAAQAKADPLAARESSPMTQAAQDIKADHLEEALRAQQTAEQALRATADELRMTPLPDHSPDPQQTPDEAVRRADQAASDAQRSADEADRSAESARERSRKADDLPRQAQQTGNAEAAEEKAAQVAAAKRDAEEAGQWAAAARQSAEAAQEADEEALVSAAQVPREAQPKESQAAEEAQKAQDQAADAARQAVRQADLAAEFARQTAALAAEPGAPQEQAAKAAAESPNPTQPQAREAANPAAPADNQTQPAPGKGEPAAPAADEKQSAFARQASEEAQAAQQSAQAAGQSAQAAQQAAEQAQQAAPSSQRGSPQEGQQAQADQARQAAAAAQRQSAAAQQSAQQAAAAAQRAQEQAQQSAGASSPQEAKQAMLAAGKAAAESASAARDAAEAAQRAQQNAQAGMAPQQANKLDGLAAQQDSLARDTADLMARRSAVAENIRGELTPAVQEEQTRLAGEAAQLAQQVGKALPQSGRLASQAAEEAQAAAQAAGRPDLPEAARTAEASAGDLNQLARNLRDVAVQATGAPASAETPPSSPLAPLAQQAGDLAARQQAMGEQMRDLASDRPMTQISGSQENLAGQVEQLSREANLLRDAARDLGLTPQMTHPAAEAASRMDRARQQAGQAASQLNRAAEAPQSTPAYAVQNAQASQQNAAQALQQAAQALQGMAQALGQASPQPSPEQANSAMPQAYQQAREAAQSQQAGDAIQAAQSMAQAARQATAQARALGANPQPPNPQSMVADGRGGLDSSAPVSSDSPSLLTRLGWKLRDWLRLPGELRDEVLQAAGPAGPEEYRPIIKRYFEEVSKRGGKE